MALYDRMHSTGYCVRLSASQSEHMDLGDLLDRIAPQLDQIRLVPAADRKT